jgi:hypothetical protein
VNLRFNSGLFFLFNVRPRAARSKSKASKIRGGRAFREKPWNGIFVDEKEDRLQRIEIMVNPFLENSI